MLRTIKTLRSFAAVALVAGTVLMSAGVAIADKVHLKDGRVIDGEVVRETDSFVQIKVKVGGIETVQTFPKSAVTKVEKGASAPAAPAAPAATAAPDAPRPADAPQQAETAIPPAPSGGSTSDKAAERARRIDSGATRVAILNFGAPSSWSDNIGDMVGLQVNAASWRAAVPLLDKDKVDVVVVRINSGGGMGSELQPFQDLFENVYKKKYRTVGWVESAISAAAMGPYVIEEFYFMPNGNLGACTGWYGDLQNVEGVQLEHMLAQMEEASRLGRRSPAIMRAMQIQVPLSASIDPVTGDVTWYQDNTGDTLLNPGNQIFTITASDAVKFKFAKGIAATKEELVKVMGLNEVEWAGQEATRLVDENMRAVDRAEKRWQLAYEKFLINMGFAEGAQDKTERGKFAGIARKALREMKTMFATNKNLGAMVGINDEWFTLREEEIKRLLSEDR